MKFVKIPLLGFIFLLDFLFTLTLHSQPLNQPHFHFYNNFSNRQKNIKKQTKKELENLKNIKHFSFTFSVKENIISHLGLRVLQRLGYREVKDLKLYDHLTISPNKSDCYHLEKYARGQKSLKEIWETCWGVPYSFTRIPLKNYHLLYPDPTEITFTNLIIKNQKISDLSIENIDELEQSFMLNVCVSELDLVIDKISTRSLLDNRTYVKVESPSFFSVKPLYPEKPFCVSGKIFYSFTSIEDLFYIKQESVKFSLEETPFVFSLNLGDLNQDVEDKRAKKAFVHTNPLTFIDLSYVSSLASNYEDCLSDDFNRKNSICSKTLLDHMVRVYTKTLLSKLLKKKVFPKVVKKLNTHVRSGFKLSSSKLSDSQEELELEKPTLYIRKIRKSLEQNIDFDMHLLFKGAKSHFTKEEVDKTFTNPKTKLCQDNKVASHVTLETKIETINYIMYYFKKKFPKKFTLCFDRKQNKISCHKTQPFVKFKIRDFKFLSENQKLFIDLSLKVYKKNPIFIFLVKKQRYKLKIPIKPFYNKEKQRISMFKYKDVKVKKILGLNDIFNLETLIFTLAVPVVSVADFMILDFSINYITQLVIENKIKNLENSSHLKYIKKPSICTENNKVYFSFSLENEKK